MIPVCVPARAVFLTAAGAGTAGAVTAAAVLEPWLLLGPCMALMLGYAAVCAVAEHRRRAAAVPDRTAAAPRTRGGILTEIGVDYGACGCCDRMQVRGWLRAEPPSDEFPRGRLLCGHCFSQCLFTGHRERAGEARLPEGGR